MCRLLQVSTATVLADNTNVALSWDTEDYDDYGMHSPSVNPTRITILSGTGDGKYLFKGSVLFPARADYITIGAVIAKNGGNQPSWERVGPNVSSAQRTVSVMATLPMVVGDYCELIGLQDNTANAAATTPIGSSFESSFECIKVSE
jgi:hypothetical protein